MKNGNQLLDHMS